jgi:mono/diheme cytochrome c family protein
MRNLLLVALAAGTLAAAPPQTAKQEAAPAAAGPANPNRALLDRYCVTCHNKKLKTASLAFDLMDISHPEKEPIVWERAIRKLRGGMMPPPGMPRPPLESVSSLATYLETSLDKAAIANPDPGTVRIHRLNRAEYANAMRDLFGLDVDSAALLPSDDINNGFDNIAEALKVSPSFLDQYIMAARAVAKEAIGTPLTQEDVKTTLRGMDHDIPLPPGARGGITARFLTPYEGDYEIRATNNPAVFTVDGTAVDSKGRTHLTAGEHSIVAANAGHSFVESEGELFGFVPGAAGTGYSSTGTVVGGIIANGNAGGGRGGRGGRGGGPSVTVDGPFNPTGNPVDTVSRTRVFICRAPDPREETACASRILTNLATKAYRRPVTEKDLAPLLRFYDEGRKAGNFEGGIENATVAMLASAKFLYRVEPPPADAKPGSIYKLNGAELASRLSFFLWSSIPDEELRTVAEQGKLSDPKVLDHQVRRMLADPRAKTLITNFAFEWLKIRDMDALEPDPYVYPSFNAPLRAALKTEMELFLDSVFRGDRSVVDLLSANYTFVNERLAEHYGIQNVRGDEFRRVTLTDPNRFGLLGKGAVLMVTAYPNRTSPVLRGSYILENIMGTPPSPPPPNVPAFKENKDGEKAHTVREIMEEHRANPTCNACHGIMDPLGFALENFDTIGSYRTMDRFTRTKIDVGGKLVDGTVIGGPVDLRNALLKHPAQFVQTMTEKMMTYALGRGVEYYDMPAIRKIVRDAGRDNYKFSDIVAGIVTTPAFRSSIVEPTKADPKVESARVGKSEKSEKPATVQVAAK